MTDLSDLNCSPMIRVSLALPQKLLRALDDQATKDDASAPNRSSVIRRYLIGGLRREAA
ncbi:hypothetical protein [Nitrobacter winogradskyi]|uniref:Metal-responsive CopG/Arc/MetJ family transcriptional regulator n=2 Tax=Nitrobacter winogradskyi TaxID=913 RepID=A0ACC6AMG7_NITWI|nr:hypothetical protein [Nitrobacter winogradskyi]MCP2000969.1 metal-responsive CopG/Arc/MetJ family transcriptional regulator [Nitrobacter winogradskyi]GEC14659.1 hypothetical protein NWI01_05510 [Nitrobacter winogradskyi]